MKLRLLRSAIEDLADGRSFYDLQQPGVGDWFFDSLFSDIEAVVLRVLDCRRDPRKIAGDLKSVS